MGAESGGGRGRLGEIHRRAGREGKSGGEGG